MRESRSSSNLRKRSHLGEEERQRFLYQTALHNYVSKEHNTNKHFAFSAQIDTNFAELNAAQKDKHVNSIS